MTTRIRIINDPLRSTRHIDVEPSREFIIGLLWQTVQEAENTDETLRLCVHVEKGQEGLITIHWYGDSEESESILRAVMHCAARPRNTIKAVKGGPAK